jgi:hypothetical protein
MHIKRVWKEYLPVQTTCIRITRFNLPLYVMWLRERYAKYRRRGGCGVPRVKDVYRIIEELEHNQQHRSGSQKLFVRNP